MPAFKPKANKKIKINKKNNTTLDGKHKEFLYEFTKRRKDIDLTVFPKTFLEWIQIENVL